MGGSESRNACDSVKRADSAVKYNKNTDAMRAKLSDTPPFQFFKVTNLSQFCMIHPVSMRALRRVKAS